MNGPSDNLRPMTAADIAALHALSREAGWPHRVEDWRFLVGLGRGSVATDAAGVIGGCAAWWPFGAEAATIGMVIVSRRLQGRGIGTRLMARIFTEAGPRRLVLNATEDGRRLYEMSGFGAVGTLRQFEGIAGPAVMPAGGAGRVRMLGPEHRAAILALDRDATGMDRGALLAALQDVGLGYAHQEEGGRITGYAFTRAFGRGRVLGPLVAADDAAAITLLDAAVAEAAGIFLRADTPIEAGSFRERVGQVGLVEVGTALHMVRGAPAEMYGPARVYCIAAQALG